MNKIIATLVFVLIFNQTILAQSNIFDNADSIEIKLNEKADGFGPKGIFSSSITPKNTMNIEEQKACPEMKNIPTTLSNVVEYYYHSNRFQFFYQNYRNGVFSKDYFINEANDKRWNLRDTIQLTEKKLITTISIITGINSDGIKVYMVDSKNNGDFSDDVLKVMMPLGHKQAEVVNNSSSVDLEYFDGEVVKSDIQLMMIVQGYRTGKNEEPLFSITFPQFRYSKFNYRNKSYFVCKEFNDYYHSVYVLNDRPYFSSPNDKEVKPFQLVELDGDYFQYIPKSSNSERILLKKVPRPEDNKLPVASQIAMLAPEILGLDVLKNSNISLNSIRGKYVFIDFWSTNCGPCIAEFPKIKEVYEKYNRNQLEIIGVVDDRTGGKIKEFIQNKNLLWPTINMNINSTTIKGYDVKSYPTTYLINPDGVIIAINLRGEELLNKLHSLKIYR